ncbi:MAG: hypothetical protein JW894_14605 [Bacteroidales bacterium]|nr:hypothetical protein [Bacteroidales bacterium]
MTKRIVELIFKHFRLAYILFSLLFAFSQLIHAEINDNNNGLVQFSDTVYQIPDFDLKKAERMYYGLISLSEEAPACADCHYMNYIDTINWNPSTYEIALKYYKGDAKILLDVINTPRGKILNEVHAGYEISEEQAVLLQAYIDKRYDSGEPQKKPVINNLILFILVNIIGFAATIDLLFTRKIKFKIVHLILIIGAAIFITRTMVIESIKIGRQQDYAPTQPIKFSHKIHAGDNKIDCQYCHHTAETSKSAGIPSSNVCLNCHILIVEGTKSGKFEINKITEAQLNNDPIEWVKVHNLPDHVFFSHAQHVGAGKLDCAECHGVVESMDLLRQENDLSMGWCLDCHRTRKVDFKNNEYYALFEKYHDKIKVGEIDSVMIEDIGGTDCMKCHY